MRVRRNSTAAAAAVLLALPSVAGEIKVAPDQRYLLLATTKTNTMEQELTDAANLGFRIVLAAPSGVGLLLLMERVATPPDVYKYKLLATTRVDTMDKELNEAARDGYRLLPRTIMPKQKLIGPPEIVSVTEKAPGSEKAPLYEYKVLGTAKTSTLEKEILESRAAGYVLSGMATANERTVIMEREIGAK